MNIDGLDDPDVRDDREDNAATHGETAYTSYYGGRTIAMTGRIESYNLFKLRDMQEALRTAFVDLEEKPLYFLTGDPEVDHFINVKKLSKNQWSDEQREHNQFFREFLITLRASDPRFYLYSPRYYALAVNSVKTAQVSSRGNFPSEPLIRVHGPIDNFYIQNQSRPGVSTEYESMALKILNPIAAGDFYEFDCKRKTITDKAGNNQMSKLANTSQWINISPGENFINLPNTSNTGTNANSLVEIIYRDAWV